MSDDVKFQGLCSFVKTVIGQTYIDIIQAGQRAGNSEKDIVAAMIHENLRHAALHFANFGKPTDEFLEMCEAYYTDALAEIPTIPRTQ